MLKEKDMIGEMGHWRGPVMLGAGAFSRVYRVTNEITGEFAVCKVSSRLELAQKEAEVLKCITHPLFPTYKGRTVMGDKHYLLMEYICGSTLRQYVERRGGLSEQRTTEIAMALAKGLNYLHEQPIPVVFRDIKPENVLIQQDGRVRLVDVGCVCQEGSPDGSMAGTRAFAAPEQLTVGTKVGRESDVYALGKLVCYMLRKGSMSPGLAGLVQRAKAEEPMLRIPDMRTFILGLEGALKKENLGFYYKKNIRKET